jgi:hypothetical protein
MDRNTSLTLDIAVTTFESRGPNLRIYLNQSLIQQLNNLQQDVVVSLDLVDLQEINLLMVEHHSKDPTQISDGDIAAEIRAITIGHLPLPRNLLFDQIFYPNWQWGPTANFFTQNCYLGYNGVWQLAFPQDHRQWILNHLELELFPQQATKTFVPVNVNVDTDSPA